MTWTIRMRGCCTRGARGETMADDEWVGKVVNIIFKARHNNVRILGETSTGNSYKIVREYRNKGDPRWEPITTTVSKEDIMYIWEEKGDKI